MLRLPYGRVADRTTNLVTPEAVVLEVAAAGLASRVLAALIDVVALWAVFSALTTAAAGASAVLGPDNVVVQVALIVGAFALLVAWPIAWEVATRGRSPGKLALGLRVMTIEGAPIRFRHALIRGLVGLLELNATLGTVALLSALASRRFRRLGDHLAGTVVVRDRHGGTPATATRFIPHPVWAQWSAQLDASRLTTDDYRLVRSYLLRAGQLAPEQRQGLGLRVLDRVGDRLGLAPGSAVRAVDGWGPVPALVAVAAAYQARFDGAAARVG